MGKSVCSWVRSVLAAYLDGELKPSAAQAVRRHLEGCESCRAELRLLKDTWSLLDEAETPPVRAGFTSRMMARVVEEKDILRLEARLRPHRTRRRVMAGVLGVAAGLLLGLLLFTWTGLTAEPGSPVEREVSDHLTFLEDAELMDEMAVVALMEDLVAEADEVSDPLEGEGS